MESPDPGVIYLISYGTFIIWQETDKEKIHEGSYSGRRIGNKNFRRKSS